MGVFLRLLPSLASCHAFANVIFFQQHDATEFFEKVPRFWLAMGLSVIGFIFSFIYCMDAGLNFLGTIDFYINFVMILVGFFEAFGSAWAYDILGQFERLSPAVVWSFMVANFGAIFLVSFVACMPACLHACMRLQYYYNTTTITLSSSSLSLS
mmetsp:Transcript_5053/g.7935  ORF Transcript_5053/g.7935 Transcript_5053/m.7935 type:complete len:154 (-) Transcript_5053:725-1186(-)